MSQAYPNGGKEAGLVELLERAVTAFQDDPRYTNDIRYLRLWVQYVRACVCGRVGDQQWPCWLQADMCEDSLDIFAFLASRGIGSQLALYYEAHALDLERAGKHAAAGAVYEAGLAAMAQPYTRLLGSQQAYLGRMEKRRLRDARRAAKKRRRAAAATERTVGQQGGRVDTGADGSAGGRGLSVGTRSSASSARGSAPAPAPERHRGILAAASSSGTGPGQPRP